MADSFGSVRAAGEGEDTTRGGGKLASKLGAAGAGSSGRMHVHGAVQPTASKGAPLKKPLEPDPADDSARRRPKTMSRREMLRERRRRERAGEVIEIADYARPKTRAECKGGHRPCLFVACKHHLYLDVNPETGSIKINFPDRHVWELEETCALDVAERGGVTLEDVGDILNLTRERVRQVEVTGLQKLKGGAVKHELNAFLGWMPELGED